MSHFLKFYGLGDDKIFIILKVDSLRNLTAVSKNLKWLKILQRIVIVQINHNFVEWKLQYFMLID